MKSIYITLILIAFTGLLPSCKKESPPAIITDEHPNEPFNPKTLDSLKQKFQEHYINNRTDLCIYWDGKKEYRADSAYFNINTMLWEYDCTFFAFFPNQHHGTWTQIDTIPCSRGCIQIRIWDYEKIGQKRAAEVFYTPCKGLLPYNIGGGVGVMINELTDDYISGYFSYGDMCGAFNKVPVRKK